MVVLIFQSVSELFRFQDVKKGKNDANFLGLSPKIRFQTHITHSQKCETVTLLFIYSKGAL